MLSVSFSDMEVPFEVLFKGFGYPVYQALDCSKTFILNNTKAQHVV
jgi:hypothetical protein